MTTWYVTQRVAPTAEPLSLDEVKDHLRIVGDDEDDVLRDVLRAAREYVEHWTGRQLMGATLRMTGAAFPAGEIVMPRGPLIGVESVSHVDSAGVRQTMTASDYTAHIDRVPALLARAYNVSWPGPGRTQADSIRVDFYAGHATTFTADATADTITLAGRPPIDGEEMVLANRGGALPAGLTAGQRYYARDVVGYACSLATTVGGVAVDITGTGTGTHTVGAIPEPLLAGLRMMLGDLYENREAQAEGRLERNRTLALLLWPYRLFGGD